MQKQNLLFSWDSKWPPCDKGLLILLHQKTLAEISKWLTVFEIALYNVCKPLVIDYVMYALIVCLVLLTYEGPSYRTFVLVSGDHTFAFGDYFLPVIIY